MDVTAVLDRRVWKGRDARPYPRRAQRPSSEPTHRPTDMALDPPNSSPLLPRLSHHSQAFPQECHAGAKLLPPMANPKRKQSKRRSANRRAANAFKAPEFAKDPTDGSTFRPHRVNPKNGMYRGRQVLNVEV
jgi:large subunit ribosomal protein L32